MAFYDTAFEAPELTKVDDSRYQAAPEPYEGTGVVSNVFKGAKHTFKGFAGDIAALAGQSELAQRLRFENQANEIPGSFAYKASEFLSSAAGYIAVGAMVPEVAATQGAAELGMLANFINRPFSGFVAKAGEAAASSRAFGSIGNKALQFLDDATTGLLLSTPTVVGSNITYDKDGNANFSPKGAAEDFGLQLLAGGALVGAGNVLKSVAGKKVSVVSALDKNNLPNRVISRGEEKIAQNAKKPPKTESANFEPKNEQEIEQILKKNKNIEEVDGNHLVEELRKTNDNMLKKNHEHNSELESFIGMNKETESHYKRINYDNTRDAFDREEAINALLHRDGIIFNGEQINFRDPLSKVKLDKHIKSLEAQEKTRGTQKSIATRDILEDIQNIPQEKREFAKGLLDEMFEKQNHTGKGLENVPEGTYIMPDSWYTSDVKAKKFYFEGKNDIFNPAEIFNKLETISPKLAGRARILHNLAADGRSSGERVALTKSLKTALKKPLSIEEANKILEEYKNHSGRFSKTDQVKRVIEEDQKKLKEEMEKYGKELDDENNKNPFFVKVMEKIKTQAENIEEYIACLIGVE